MRALANLQLMIKGDQIHNLGERLDMIGFTVRFCLLIFLILL